MASYFKRPLIIKKRIQNAYSQSMTRDSGSFGICLPQSFANFDIPISKPIKGLGTFEQVANEQKIIVWEIYSDRFFTAHKSSELQISEKQRTDCMFASMIKYPEIRRMKSDLIEKLEKKVGKDQSKIFAEKPLVQNELVAQLRFCKDFSLTLQHPVTEDIIMTQSQQEAIQKEVESLEELIKLADLYSNRMD